MFQAIPEGPDIPEKIQLDLEDNNLVLFCGAGISKNNGLPLFSELVKKACKELKIKVDEQPLLKELWDKENYDSILDLVEGQDDLLGSPETLRKKVIDILNDYQGEPEIHKALLDLSALPGGGGHRLVTTNFDRLFFKAGLNPQLSDQAPRLAPPGKETWSHLTFLHGVIDEQRDPAGKNLVLTKKDFGKAYLNDGWASDFIIQLFQDFTVLFIGYGMNDPIINYLVSAMKDKQKGKDQSERKPSIYAFSRYGENQLEEVKNKWKFIGIEPIPYKLKENDDHSLLYSTIKEWSSLKTLMGKKRWLKKRIKHRDPDKENGQSVAFLLKSDENLAKFFSERDPPVDISWLKPLSENGLLDKFIKPSWQSSVFEKIPLWEPLSNSDSQLYSHIATWFCKHLDKRELIHWVIDHDCFLHPLLKRRIQWKMENKQPNEQSLKLDEEKSLFWKNVASISYNPQKINRITITNLIEKLNEKYSSIKVHELLQCLDLFIAFEKYPGPLEEIYKESTPGPKDNPESKIYETKLKARYDDWPDKISNEEILLLHAEDFTDLLKRAMEKAPAFKMVEGHRGSLYITRPSIADHERNDFYKHDNEWTYIINLARDSFDLVMKEDKSLARLLLEKWRLYSYPIFYRLILYAITKYPDLNENMAIDLLKNQDNHVLWSSFCGREVLEYLRKRKHSEKSIETLLNLIMEGPLRNIDEKIFKNFKDQCIYQRLRCFRENKNITITFSEKIEKYYKTLNDIYEECMNDPQSDFPTRHYSGSDIPGSLEPEFYVNKPIEYIVNHIKNSGENELFPEYFERQKIGCFLTLSKKEIGKAFEVLLKLSNEDLLSTPYWGAFLNEITFGTQDKENNNYFFKTINRIENCSDEFIKKSSFLDIFNSRGYLIYGKDEDKFKKWWNNLRDLYISPLAENEKSEYQSFHEDYHSCFGKLTKAVFYVLWRHYFPHTPDETSIDIPETMKDRLSEPWGFKFEKDEKIPQPVKEYFEILLKKDIKLMKRLVTHYADRVKCVQFQDRLENSKSL